MARLIRPLRQWPRLQQHCRASAGLYHVLSSSCPLTVAVRPALPSLSFATATSPRRIVRHRPQGVRLPNAPPSSDLQEGDSSEDDVKKSRNQKKREARRAVRWGMDLASFSNPQIKRILRVASLEQEVFEAIMLVQRLGPDVREGKRRQFNYIGKLLREVEPELMEALILATKVGDQKMLQALAASKGQLMEDDDEDEIYEETEDEEDDDEMSQVYISTANRWFDGLISKDNEITNEVYSISTVEFDRQELRKLVRGVLTVQEQSQVATEENKAKGDAAMKRAKNSLFRFLHTIAKRLPGEEEFDFTH